MPKVNLSSSTLREVTALVYLTKKDAQLLNSDLTDYRIDHPLEDIPFQKYKSNIRYLDYSSLGIPSIISNVIPFSESIRHNKTALLVNNHSDDWFNAIKSLIQDEELRETIGNNAFYDLCKNYPIESSILEWKEIIYDLMEDKTKLTNEEIGICRSCNQENKLINGQCEGCIFQDRD